jgi:hypothetical protein
VRPTFDGRDDGNVALSESIEKRRFANVWSSAENNTNTITNEFAFVAVSEISLNSVTQHLDFVNDMLKMSWVEELVFTKVDEGLHVCETTGDDGTPRRVETTSLSLKSAHR